MRIALVVFILGALLLMGWLVLGDISPRRQAPEVMVPLERAAEGRRQAEELDRQRQQQLDRAAEAEE